MGLCQMLYIQPCGPPQKDIKVREDQDPIQLPERDTDMSAVFSIKSFICDLHCHGAKLIYIQSSSITVYKAPNAGFTIAPNDRHHWGAVLSGPQSYEWHKLSLIDWQERASTLQSGQVPLLLLA